MGNFLSNLTADADPTHTKSPVGPLRPHPPNTVKGYNGAQPSCTESAQGGETESTMRRPISPMLAPGPSAPSAYPTTFESTLDLITQQPTSQMDEPYVTFNLFSPTTPEPTIIPETPTMYETPMVRTPASPSAQLSSDHLPLERKTREDSPSHRRRHHAQSRLNDRTKVTPKLVEDCLLYTSPSPRDS